jgi:hypothetical protein
LETQLCQMVMTQKTIFFPLYQIYWHNAISWRSGKLVGSGEKVGLTDDPLNTARISSRLTFSFSLYWAGL